MIFFPTPETENARVQEHAGRSIATSKDKMNPTPNIQTTPAQRNLLDMPLPKPSDAERKWLEHAMIRGKTNRLSEVISITPGLAGAMLVHNILNRPLTESQIAKHISRLERGAFILTHQGIAFAKTGVLNDGQHRLTAIYRSGIAADMQVTFGAEREEFEVVDVGGTRTSAHILSIKQEHNASLRASVAATLLYLDTKDVTRPDQQLVSQHAMSLRGPGMDLAIQAGHHLRKVCAPTVSAVAYWSINTKTKRPDLVASFFDKLDTGEGLLNPKLKLREWLKDKNKDAEQRGSSTVQRVAVIIHAWNAFVTKKKTFATDWKHAKSLPDPL